MPKTQEIISSLESIANDYVAVAVFWHIAFYILLTILLVKWEPSNKLLGVLLCLPLFSVAMFAWIAGNPFNGILFLAIGILVFIFALRTSPEPIAFSSVPFMVIGVLMIIFGLVYPHFIHTDSFIKYFYATPLGLVPCPTLSLLIGFMLLYNGFGSNAMTITFIIFGFFYGIFGVLKLGVHLDIGLILGTTGLLVKYLLMVKNPVT
jgi:hypothetical protein